MALDLKGMAPLLQVYDMPASLRFYRDVLGFEVASTSPELGPDKYHWVLLRLSGIELMLNTAYEFDEERPVPPDPDRVKAHDDAGLFFGCPDLDAAYTELRARGIDLKPPSLTGYGFQHIFLRDPDGFGLTFHWPASDPK